MALIAHWKLDDNSANTTVVATVGTNATLVGGDNTSAKTVAGPGGTITAGLALNGSDDHIDISASSISFATNTAFSISIWFTRAGTLARLCGAAAAASGRILGVDDDTIRAVNGGGASSDFDVPSMGTTNWHHLLVTRTSGNSLRVFLDGVESSSGAKSVTGTFALDSVGKSGNAFTNGFAAAQVKIFDTDESANVSTLYAEGVGGGGGGTGNPWYYQANQAAAL